MKLLNYQELYYHEEIVSKAHRLECVACTQAFNFMKLVIYFNDKMEESQK